MFDFADSIKAVGEAFTSLFNYCQTNTEHQSETQIVKDKRRLKKSYERCATDFYDKRQVSAGLYLA